MLIALDYDGVLVDSIQEMVKIANLASKFIGNGHSFTTKDFQEIDELTFENVGKIIGIPEVYISKFTEQIFYLLRKEVSEPKVFAEMPEVIQTLSQKHTIILITSNLKKVVENTLKNHKLSTCISKIVDGTDPAPKSKKILQAGLDYHVAPDQVVMAGDTASDIKHGKAAGAKTIAVTWGFQPEELLQRAHPDYIAKRPDDLLKIISSMSGKTQEA